MEVSQPPHGIGAHKRLGSNNHTELLQLRYIGKETGNLMHQYLDRNPMKHGFLYRFNFDSF